MDADSKIPGSARTSNLGGEKIEIGKVTHNTKGCNADHKRIAIYASCFRNLVVCRMQIFILSLFLL